jgi:phosphoribosyl 1,2-cyclic phosphate phosphodiesterase
MKIKILGTAAAEAYPALFCDCENCTKARELGGKNIRCRSSALVNDDLLLDYGPDTTAQTLRYNVNLRKASNIFLTHSHNDHISMYDFQYRFPNFRGSRPVDKTTIWGNPTSIDTFLSHLIDGFKEVFAGSLSPSTEEIEEELPDFLNLFTKRIEPHQTLEVDGKYIVYTINAHHKEPELSMNYLIQEINSDGSKGTVFLYGTDTGPWGDSEWEYLESLNLKIDIVALDCTVGVNKPGGHHSNESFLEAKSQFEKRNLLSPDAIFYAHHFSHQANFVYDDLVEYMKPHNVKVTYDGLEIEK